MASANASEPTATMGRTTVAPRLGAPRDQLAGVATGEPSKWDCKPFLDDLAVGHPMLG